MQFGTVRWRFLSRRIGGKDWVMLLLLFGLEYVFYGRGLFFFFDACGSCHSMLYVRNESCLLTNWSLPTSWGETLPSWSPRMSTLGNE